jgi:hypothetical protein
MAQKLFIIHISIFSTNDNRDDNEVNNNHGKKTYLYVA